MTPPSAITHTAKHLGHHRTVLIAMYACGYDVLYRYVSYSSELLECSILCSRHTHTHTQTHQTLRCAVALQLHCRLRKATLCKKAHGFGTPGQCSGRCSHRGKAQHDCIPAICLCRGSDNCRSCLQASATEYNASIAGAVIAVLPT